MRKILFILVVAYATLYFKQHGMPVPGGGAADPRGDQASSANWRGNQSTTPKSLPANAGIVTSLLPDDLQGSRHQKFILRLGSGQTVLVAHNIDIAPRISGLRVGDVVEYRGVFESNPQGGVIHWTHRDPSGRHPGGWLKHNGRIYQ